MEFETVVFVAVIVNVFVTVRFAAMRFEKLEVPYAVIPTVNVAPVRAVKVPVEVSE